MSVFNVKTTCFQSLKSRFYLPSFFIKYLSFIRFIERYYYLKLRSLFFVYYSGCREITEFSIDTNNLTVKCTLINSEITKQPGSLYLMTLTRYLHPKVFTYTNMILNAYPVKIFEPFIPYKFSVSGETYNS